MLQLITTHPFPTLVSVGRMELITRALLVCKEVTVTGIKKTSCDRRKLIILLHKPLPGSEREHPLQQISCIDAQLQRGELQKKKKKWIHIFSFLFPHPFLIPCSSPFVSTLFLCLPPSHFSSCYLIIPAFIFKPASFRFFHSIALALFITASPGNTPSLLTTPEDEPACVCLKVPAM